MAYKAAPITDRFWSKVDKSGGPNACWPWMGSRTAKGYGRFCLRKGEFSGAHQYAFFLKHGFQPVMTCHSCDNPPCCNDAHLFAGSGKANSDDKVAKDRQAKGESQGSSKLTEATVLELRKRYIPRDAKHGTRAMAREFGVSQMTISKAIRATKWAHVDSDR